MVLFRITENEPSKMHNVRPYVYSRPCAEALCIGDLKPELNKQVNQIIRPTTYFLDIYIYI